MYKQIIIVRKDLYMSPGKMSAQVSHASMAFITSQMKRYFEIPDKRYYAPKVLQYKYNGYIQCPIFVKKQCFDEWICGSFTKCVLQARNKNHLLKAKTMAEEMNMVDGEDFFCIYDNCRTELEPEFIDDDGVGRCLTCIGFTPMPEEVIDKIGKKYHLYT